MPNPLLNALKRALHDRGWAYCRLPPTVAERPDTLWRPTLGGLLETLAADDLAAWTFCQVGAFDGVAHDDLHGLVKAHGWRGVLIEPQPSAAERLRAHYADQPQVIVVNRAVSAEPGRVTMHTPADDADSPITSFDREHVVRHLRNAGRPTTTRTLEVEAAPLTDVLADAGLAQPDLLQVDAEGFDYEIVSRIDLRTLRPRVIRYEHAHLTRDEQDTLVRKLADDGYRFVFEPVDTTAIRPDDG